VPSNGIISLYVSVHGGALYAPILCPLSPPSSSRQSVWTFLALQARVQSHSDPQTNRNLSFCPNESIEWDQRCPSRIRFGEKERERERESLDYRDGQSERSGAAIQSRGSAVSLPSRLTVLGVSLTHASPYARIIINGTRVGVVAHTYRSGARAYICAARGQRCVIALPIEFSYTGMASLMHKMTEPNSVIVRFTKRIRPRVVNIARRCERQCHIVTTEFSGARKYAVIR